MSRTQKRIMTLTLLYTLIWNTVYFWEKLPEPYNFGTYFLLLLLWVSMLLISLFQVYKFLVEHSKDYYRLLNSGLVLLVSGLYLCCPGGLFDFAKYQKHKNILAIDDDRGTSIQLRDAAEVSPMVYISKNSGNTWEPYANGLPQDATVSCFKSFGKKVIASTEFHGIYLDDGSNHWESIAGNLPKNIQIKAVEVIGNTMIIGTTKHGIFRSDNAGKSWTQESSPFNNVQIRCLMQHDGILFAGINLGIYQSLDTGKTWMHRFGNVQINGFAQSKDKFYAGLVNGAAMSEDQGTTWNYIYKPNTLHDISSDGRYVYAMTLGAGLLKSANDGTTWENANGTNSTFDRYTFEVKNIGNKLFAAQWTGIYRSSDKGANWELVTDGLPENTAFTTLELTQVGLLAGLGLRKK